MIAASRGATVSTSVLDTLPVLATFASGGAELLEARALLSRIDRKFLLPMPLLPHFLGQLRDDYRLLPAAGHPAAAYRTVYFDTADRSIFHDHRRGRCPRIKVRIRHHLDRQLSFLEVKRKRAANRTAKVRTALPFGEQQLDAAAVQFIDARCPYPALTLAPCISNDFTRLTLLGDRIDERLTIDWGLSVSDGQRTAAFPDAVIVEIKQSRHSNSGPAARTLRQLRVREGAFSKYCLATAWLGATRLNPFKPALRALERLST